MHVRAPRSCPYMCQPHAHIPQATKLSLAQRHTRPPAAPPSNASVSACRAMYAEFAAGRQLQGKQLCWTECVLLRVLWCWTLAKAAWQKALQRRCAAASAAPDGCGSSRGSGGSRGRRAGAARGSLHSTAARSSNAVGAGAGAAAAPGQRKGAASAKAWGQALHACMWTVHALYSRSPTVELDPDIGQHHVVVTNLVQDLAYFNVSVETMKVRAWSAMHVCAYVTLQALQTRGRVLSNEVCSCLHVSV